MTEIKYVEEIINGYTLHRIPVKRSGGVLGLLPGQGQDGYGGKITTDICLRVVGETKKRRVYATCYSNCASHWITFEGTKLHLREFSSDDILD